MTITDVEIAPKDVSDPASRVVVCQVDGKRCQIVITCEGASEALASMVFDLLRGD